jgi:serine/threonine protein kinase
MLKASSTIILLILPVFLFSGTKEKLQSGTLPKESLPTEGYHLEVRPDGIRLEGNSGAGLFYAMQTFLQLTTGDEMHTIHRLLAGGRLPVRVTHNDTKFNNILFDANNKAICMVDLDTVMPGTVLYDFGDAIRTGANKAAEDEADLEKVSLDLDLFEAYSRGFLETAGSSLTRIEIDHLAFSAKFMTYIIGLRFLTDHINGNIYFKVAYPGHNLQRARSQFRLLSEMEKQAEAIEKIIRTFF